MQKINLYISKGFMVFTGLVLLSACTKEAENWGYISKYSKIDEVVANQSTREDVFEKLGSPTSKSSFGSEKWFYIGSEVTKETFFKPEILNHEVYTVTFNEAGVVTSIDKKGKEAKAEIELAEDVTATEGNEITFTQQLLGNLGKFNRDSMMGGRRGDPTSTRVPR
jgi:outer membrane protein assembly factor BamE (lipoprotein component of BamABCDE complex)